MNEKNTEFQNWLYGRDPDIELDAQDLVHALLNICTDTLAEQSKVIDALNEIGGPVKTEQAIACGMVILNNRLHDWFFGEPNTI